ncbi:MAG: hypothetical protein WEA24_10580 [Gemmatimonadota bacterium]
MMQADRPPLEPELGSGTAPPETVDARAVPAAWAEFAAATATEVRERARRVLNLDPAESGRLAARMREVMDSALEVPPGLSGKAAERAADMLERCGPEPDLARVAWERTRWRARRTAAVGAVTTIPALVPGVGAALGALGLVADWRYAADQQRDLVLEIAALYGVQLTDPTVTVRALFLASAGAAFGSGAAGEVVAKVLARRVARRSVARLVPGAGAAAVGALNYVATVAIGRAAIERFAAAAGAPVSGLVPRRIHPAMPWLRSLVVECMDMDDVRVGAVAPVPPEARAALAQLSAPERDELLDLAAASAAARGGVSDAELRALEELAELMGFSAVAARAARDAAVTEATRAGGRVSRLLRALRAGGAGGADVARRAWGRAARLARRRGQR